MLKKDLVKKVKDLEATVQKLRSAILQNANIISNYTKQISIANATIDKLENESSVIGNCSTNEDLNINTIKNIYNTIQEYRRITNSTLNYFENNTDSIDINIQNKGIEIDIDTIKRQMKKGYVGTTSDIVYDDSDNTDNIDITDSIDITNNTDIETPIFNFSLTKVVNRLFYCSPELVNCYSLLDLLMVNWSNIDPCEYEQTLDRGKDYDLRRISYFLKNGVGDEPIDLEYDGQTLVINDGNHRFAALLLSFIKTNIDPNEVINEVDVYNLDLLNSLGINKECRFKGRLYGFQDILIDLL